MKYNKELFINNVKCLVMYNYEPELTINLKNEESVFIVAYKDYIELSKSGNTIKLNCIEDIFNFIHFEDILAIEGDIDFEYPIQSQSIVIDGNLWIDGISPKQVMKRFKKKVSIFKWFALTTFIGIIIYFIITTLNTKTFDTSLIIAISIFVASIVLIMFFCTIYEIKRNKLIQKYYGVICEEDKQLAKKLLDKIKIVENNEYDIYDLFHYDVYDLNIKQILKLLIKGKKIYIGLYDSIKKIEQELLENNVNNQYNDKEFNNYIFDLIQLLERNTCDI